MELNERLFADDVDLFFDVLVTRMREERAKTKQVMDVSLDDVFIGECETIPNKET